MSNPNASAEAKEHSCQVIDEFERNPETREQRAMYNDEKDETRVNVG